MWVEENESCLGWVLYVWFDNWKGRILLVEIGGGLSRAFDLEVNNRYFF